MSTGFRCPMGAGSAPGGAGVRGWLRGGVPFGAGPPALRSGDREAAPGPRDRGGDKVGLVAIGHGCEQDAVEGGVPRLNQIDPLHVHVTERPGVPELRSRRRRPNGRGVVALRVKGRVQIDQVHRLGVHAPHDREVVPRPNSLVGPVRLAHAPDPIRPRSPGQAIGTGPDRSYHWGLALVTN